VFALFFTNQTKRVDIYDALHYIIVHNALRYKNGSQKPNLQNKTNRTSQLDVWLHPAKPLMKQSRRKPMSDTVLVQEEVTENSFSVTEMAHKSIQVSLGAVDMAQAEVVALMEKVQKSVQELVEKSQKNVNELVSEMAERGAKVEEDGRARINTFVENRRKQVDSTISDASDNLNIDGRIENVLHTMNVPTKNDIEELNKKVGLLTRKVNALLKAQKDAEVVA
jgi:poly(hydroxyalkanoate) granule-associated protein